ncbi:MAG: WD40 repeat domain-containing protein, partial [Gemmataceae bacterium]
MSNGKCLRTFEGHTDDVASGSWSPDGRYVLSGSWDKTLRLWEVASGKCLRKFKGHTDLVVRVAWSPDGRLA